MMLNAKQGLLAVVAKKRRNLLPNDVIFQKTKMIKSKKKDRWLFTGSLIEIEYTLMVHPLTRVTYPRTLRYEKLPQAFHVS